MINNAAQTLTDPIAAETKAIQNEIRLQRLLGNTSSVVANGYEATIRGGSQMLGGLIEAQGMATVDTNEPYTSYTSQKVEGRTAEAEQLALNTAEGREALVSRPLKSSLVQSLEEIPYEDLISAHSVNTFVPLILIRELLPRMGHPYSNDSILDSKDIAHIINISSREGIFESSSSSREKAGHHVHTNMSKAGFNMITETEAAIAWKSKRVAMNTVDPGYMSAAPEMRNRGECPIGSEDGAGRVLWPIALAEGGDPPVWGRFWKHFGGAEVDVGLGR